MQPQKYKHLLRAYQKQTLDPTQDLIIYINDFYPYDRDDLKKDNEAFRSAHVIKADSDDTDDDDVDFTDVRDSAAAAEEEFEESDEATKNRNPFIVRIFGIEEKSGASISVDVCEFLPYFYIKVPDNWAPEPDCQTAVARRMGMLMEAIKPKVYYKNRDSLVSARICQGKPFSHFTADDKFNFIKLVFYNYEGFKSYRNAFKKPILINGLGRKAVKYELFESNIHPLLRLIHAKQINPSGWIRLPRNLYRVGLADVDKRLRASWGSSDQGQVPQLFKLSSGASDALGKSLCQLHVEVDWQHIESLSDKMEIPKLICAAFDIEADSSHGDFPIACKTYQKLARELISAHKFDRGRFFRGQEREKVLRWLKLAFDPHYRNDGIMPVALDRTAIKWDSLVKTIDGILLAVLGLAREYFNLKSIETVDDDKRPSDDDLEDPEVLSDADCRKVSKELLDCGASVELLDRTASDVIDDLHVLLERTLPVLDVETFYEFWDYATLAKAICQQYRLQVRQNSESILEAPIECLRCWLQLVFDRYYDGEEINHVYLLTDRSGEIGSVTHEHLSRLVPKILDFFALEALEKQTTSKPDNYITVEDQLDRYLSQYLPKVAGDRVIQIGTTFKRYGESECFLKHIITLYGCLPIDRADLIADEHKSITLPKKVMLDEMHNWVRAALSGRLPKHLVKTVLEYIELDPSEHNHINLEILNQRRDRQLETDQATVVVESYETEAEVLLAWSRLIRESDPEIILGYNIFGFDFKYMYERAIALGVIGEFSQLGRFGEAPREPKTRDEATARGEHEATARGEHEATARGEHEATARGEHEATARGENEAPRGPFAPSELRLFQSFCRTPGPSDRDEFSSGYHQLLKEQELSSSGLGDNILTYIEMFGRVTCDLFKVVQANYKLASYKLDAVCKEFMYMSKNDLPPKELFILQKGSDADRQKIARYCLIDCILCNRLVDKLEILTNNIGMSNVCSVPFSYLFLRGQGIKILSLVAREIAKEGFLLPVLPDVKGTEAAKFEGACVLPAKSGIILRPVSVVDFASLYPREMMASNLSHDSYVEPGSKWDNLPGYEYLDVKYDLLEDREVVGSNGKPGKKLHRVVVGRQTSRFVQSPNGQKSLLPRILKMLLDARESTRKQQKAFDKGSFKWNVLEGLQLAYKVTANSLYGQTGANSSKIRKKPIAASTTAGGRNLIHFVDKFYTENYPGAKTIYGDSVMGYTPILLLDPDSQEVIVKRIKELGELFTPYPGFKLDSSADRSASGTCKEQSKCKYLVWSSTGWTRIRRVIRHLTVKNIYRVRTTSGIADVTEDHSLLDISGKQIKPTELVAGQTNLLHGYPECPNNCCSSSDEYDSDTEDRQSKAPINRRFYNFCRKVASCKKPANYFTMTRCTQVEAAESYWQFSQMGYRCQISKGPAFESSEQNESFHDLGALPISSDKNCRRISEELLDRGNSNDDEELSASQLEDGFEGGDWGFLVGKELNTDSTVRSVELLIKDYQGMVYDLETETGNFQAGIGSLIVKNTDSCFVAFDTKDYFGNQLRGLDSVYRSMELAMEGAEQITKLIKQPHDLTFEKIIYPFMLFSKKRYTGLYYTDPFDNGCFQKSMGIVLKRRDNAQIVKKIYGRVIQLILYEQDVARAFQECRNMLEAVLRGDYSVDDFLITKSLRGYYKNPERIAHKVLADRIGRRDPGNKPQSNDRMEYAYIKLDENKLKSGAPDHWKSGEKILQGDRIETPGFIKEKGLSLDYKLYVTNQLMKPILQIFEMTEFDGEKMFTEVLRDYDYRIKGIRRITDFFGGRISDPLAGYKRLCTLSAKNDTDSSDEDSTKSDSDAESDVDI